MDHSTSTVQSVAQAVQAATAQQQLQQQQAAQQQASHPSPPVQPSIQSSVVDNLTCQWQGCGERTDTAESLYDHVCERHVGRKSTNNLNLTCQWGACRTTTVKRDHITSHIRVHVPLKPHKCDFCGKAFKRPQDLKKHVKTHADDSVLMSSPSHGNNGARGSMGAGGLGQQNGKTQGYYPASHDTSMTNPYPNYQPAMGAAQNGNSYAQPAANGYSGYGSVSYPNNSAIQDLQSMDTRRRAIEALNDFLGDIKRRAIDPSSYYDVGQRLQSNSLPLPVGSGYNTGYNNNASGFSNYNATNLLDAFTNSGNMGGGGSGLQAGVATQTYGLPLPNARTKNDLQDIDRFLEQLQATVYETSGQQSVAGVQQPGIHAMHTGEYGFSNHHGQFRSSDSPPDFHGNSSMSGLGALSSMSSMPGATTSTALDTPALTPASVSSYTSSGHSPVSSNGRSSFGNISGRQMYPNLPSVTGISDIGAGYPTTTSAPASGLASGFEGLEERRYSGGRLQRQAPAQDTEMKDADEGARTPKASEGKSKRKGHSTIDPALRDEDSASTPAGSSSEGAEDRRQEEWVENIRVIETIKKWVAERLKNGEYEEAESERKDAVDSSKSSIEIAKMVEEKMADADNSEDVKYPTLPST